MYLDIKNIKNKNPLDCSYKLVSIEHIKENRLFLAFDYKTDMLVIDKDIISNISKVDKCDIDIYVLESEDRKIMSISVDILAYTLLLNKTIEVDYNVSVKLKNLPYILLNNKGLIRIDNKIKTRFCMDLSISPYKPADKYPVLIFKTYDDLLRLLKGIYTVNYKLVND